MNIKKHLAQKQAAGFKLRWDFNAKDRGNPVRRVQSPNGDGEYTVWDDAYGKIHWTLQKPGVSTGLGSPSPFRSWNAATQDAENHALGRGRWRSNRTAARKPGGLYGFTKQTQNDCETASRAVQRAASRIARRIYAKDRETAPFLSTHSKRGKSMAAKILTAAMGDIGPKVASVNCGKDNALRTRLADLREQRGSKVAGFSNEADVWFDKLVGNPEGSEKLLLIARFRPTEDMYNKFKALLARARGPWALPLQRFVANMDAGKYTAEFRRMFGPTSQVSELFDAFRQGATYLDDGMGVAASSKAGSGDANAKYLNSLLPRRKNEILKSMARHYGISIVEAEKELIDRDAEALYEYLAADRPLAMGVLRDFRQMRLASKKAKSREYGMYGFQARTANLGLSACMEVKEQAGRVAARLHGRKASQHEKLTGFLKTHGKEARCLYSRLLLQSYPDSDRRCASAPPTTVAGWLAMDNPRQATRIPSNAPREVKQVAKASIENAKEAGDDDRVHISNHEEGRWVIGDNYEQMPNLVYYEGKDEWYYMPNWGSEKLIRGGLREALANASIMWTG